jgi:hypothetical protein
LIERLTLIERLIDRSGPADSGAGARMSRLEIADLCARLVRPETLCDHLEDARNDREKYRELTDRIRIEQTVW